MSVERKPELDELMHYGVKGMKWGVRKKRADSGPSRREQKKALWREVDAKRDDDILGARQRIQDSADRVNMAKKKYAQEKKTIGKAEAKKALNKVKDDDFEIWARNRQTASGTTRDEANDKLVEQIGGIATSMILTAIAKK